MADEKDLAEQFLDLAREDLAAARALNNAEGVSDSKGGFNAQQAVEKALKAPSAVASGDALRWATRAIEWADGQLHPPSGQSDPEA